MSEGKATDSVEIGERLRHIKQRFVEFRGRL